MERLREAIRGALAEPIGDERLEWYVRWVGAWIFLLGGLALCPGYNVLGRELGVVAFLVTAGVAVRMTGPRPPPPRDTSGDERDSGRR